jgi:hypothetical protein
MAAWGLQFRWRDWISRSVGTTCGAGSTSLPPHSRGLRATGPGAGTTAEASDLSTDLDGAELPPGSTRSFNPRGRHLSNDRSSQASISKVTAADSGVKPLPRDAGSRPA